MSPRALAPLPERCVEGWIRNGVARLVVAPGISAAGRRTIFVYLAGESRRGSFSAKAAVVERTLALAAAAGIAIEREQS